MKLSNIKTDSDLQNYIEGLVNDILQIEMNSKVDAETIQNYKDVADLVAYMIAFTRRNTLNFVKDRLNIGNNIDDIIDIIIEQQEIALENFN
jgi:hypothetical protein